MKHLAALLLSLALLHEVSAGSLPPPPATGTIVSDNFSTNGTDVATQGATIAARTPNLANQPGTAWVNIGGGTANYETTLSTAGNPLPSASLPFQSGVGVNISSVGSYVKPTTLTLEADLEVAGIGGSASASRGVMLGYYSQTGGSLSNNFFTGFVLDSTGALSFEADYTGNAFPSPTVSSSVAFTGTFNSNAFNHLTFGINTTTGNVTSLTLSGSTSDYSSLLTASNGFFTDAHTTFLGIGASSSNAGAPGFADNVKLSSVPEPSTWALLIGGTAIVGLVQRRRRSA